MVLPEISVRDVVAVRGLHRAGQAGMGIRGQSDLHLPCGAGNVLPLALDRRIVLRATDDDRAGDVSDDASAVDFSRQSSASVVLRDLGNVLSAEMVDDWPLASRSACSSAAGLCGDAPLQRSAVDVSTLSP